MDLKSAQINKLLEVISRICTHGNTLLLFSTSSIIKKLKSKLKVLKKENFNQINFVATANLQKVAPSNIKFAQLVNQDGTAVKTAKDKIGNKDTIKIAKNFKREMLKLRNDHLCIFF